MIPANFNESFEQIKPLVEKFRQNEAHYLSAKYQEAEVRQEFLDKFFVALGWDVYHDKQPNPYEREVRIEKSVMVQGRGKRADYAFYTAPNFSQVRFMAEAKKPSRQLENAQDCFQAIRYGWNSNAPISVLTDFEQFLVLDSRYKPSIETAVNRIIKEKSFRYTDFADEEKFREIYYLFSREAVAGNSLENFAASLKKGKGARQAKLFNTGIIQPIDEEFLAELDEQRVILAKAFKNRNSELDGEILTELTQRTLDRLVFLRFLEDKLVETDSVIDNLGKKSGSAWRDFIAEMPRLNQIYNGTLFRTHSILDNPEFAPDERAFCQTRDWLAHINSPYDFNSIPIHILGSIYERFLGKTIETTDKRATVIEKPEVRKAGGVYYTPEYIVRYIVENTIGKLLFRVPPSGGAASGAKPPKGGTQNKATPEEIAEMRFADIACGSGSFLLGVFDYLIKYHVEYFSENETRRKKAVKDGLCRETIEGNLQLSINYKREILTNNIFGVDLDAQAVEVAQLSLYLKLLEEETTATKQQFLTGFREQLLPKLDKNIVHGNSLIDYDILDGMLFDTRELKQLNPLNFPETFPEIFKKGGFDAIIGNPPYGAAFNSQTKRYFTEKFKFQNYQLDSYLLFLEKSFKNLIKQNGYWGMIIPNPWLTNVTQTLIRKFVVENTLIHEIVHFKFPVFPKVTVDTEIVILQNNKSENFESKVSIFNSATDFQDKNNSFIEIIHNQNDWKKLSGEVINIFLSPKDKILLSKLKEKTIPLENYLNINVGIKPYQVGKGKPPQIKAIVQSRPFDSSFQETELHKKYLRGSDISRYIISPIEIRYIKYGEWLAEPRPAANFNASEKLFMRQTGDSLTGCYDNSQYLCLNNMHVLVPKDNLENIKYFLGLINSKLLNWFHQSNNPEVGEALAEVKKTHVAQLPIRAIDFGNSGEKAAHDKIVGLVEQMLEAKKSLAEARIDKDRLFFERFCASLDKQIDALVYDLYELSAQERNIIENGL